MLGNTIASTISLAGASAAAFAMITGLEVDSTISSANGAYRKIGLRDSLNSGDVQRGAGEDGALVFSKNTGASSWKDIIEIGSVHGFPAAADSTLLALGTQNGTAIFDAAWGVDLRGVTFGSEFLGSKGFYVDGSGNMAVNALVAGEVTSVSVLSGNVGDFAPGYSGSLCPTLTPSSAPTITMITPATGLGALLQVNQWSPDPASITIASGGGGSNNAPGDIETVAGTKTKIKVMTTAVGGVVTSISVTGTGNVSLFPSGLSSPWTSTSNSTASGVIPPTFCISEFQISSVNVLRPGWGYQGSETVTITPSITTGGTLVPSFSSPIVTIDGAVNVDPPPVAEAIQISGTKVLGIQRHGWTGVTGTVTRGAFNTTVVNQATVAQLLGALIEDLSTHGLIAP